MRHWYSYSWREGGGVLAGWFGGEQGEGGLAMCHALGIVAYVLFVRGLGVVRWVGGANAKKCCRELLEEGGTL